jgi:N-acetylglucosaminyl-diphospho-decaprenol L-rhamnosyltransferase
MAPPSSTDGLAQVDVVVVAYRSRDHLRGAVEPLVGLDGVTVIVVDNASPDKGLEVVSDLPVSVVRNESNLGFAKACNIGWRRGAGRYVLFLNPDARIDDASLARLVARAEDPRVGIIAPRTVTSEGRLVWSQRAFVGVRTIWAQLFFLHRLFPDATWADGIVRDPAAYERRASPDWVSGASMLLERSLLEQLGGFDERFFMYCEDMDLCRRVREAGLDVAYEPTALVVHDEGSSAPSWAMTPVLVRSRVSYADKYFAGWRRTATRAGIALHEASRALVVRGGRPARAGHLRGLLAALSSSRT